MSYYFAAYALFWAALFGYLLGLSSRQQKLNARAARLVERMARRGESPEPEPGDAESPEESR